MKKTLVLTAIAGVCIALVFTAHTIIVKRNNPVSEKWCFKTFFYCFPTMAGDMVYVGPQGPREDCLYAININSGEMEWEYCSDDAQITSPFVADGVVYIRTSSDSSKEKKYLYAIDATSGTLKWRFELGNDMGNCISPTVVEGIVYIESTDYFLYALDTHTGDLLWSFETEEIIYSSVPSAASGVVCITSENYLYAIDSQSGELKWRYKMNCIRWSSPVMANDAVYIGADDGYLYSINMISGEKNWQYKCYIPEMGFDITKAPPSVVDGVVFTGVFNTIYAIDAENGKLEWRFETGDVLNTDIIENKGVLYVGTLDLDKHQNYLCAINAQNGELEWKYETKNSVISTLVIADDVCYVGISKIGEGSYICALEIKNNR